MKNCQPCQGNCNQGRWCPVRLAEHASKNAAHCQYHRPGQPPSIARPALSAEQIKAMDDTMPSPPAEAFADFALFWRPLTAWIVRQVNKLPADRREQERVMYLVCGVGAVLLSVLLHVEGRV